MIREKPCKGTGKAKGFGCGILSTKRVLGLSILKCGCYRKYLLSPEGADRLKAGTLKGKAIVKKAAKEKDKEAREKLKTRSNFESDLQKEINTIIRLIDKGTVCISSLKALNQKFDAGHYFSVGSTPSLRFNLFNIYAQSVHCNQHLSGDSINFMEGLKLMYGKEHAEYVSELRAKYKLIKLLIPDLKEKTIIAKQIVKELKKENRTYSPKERLYLRLTYNIKIGIYG